MRATVQFGIAENVSYIPERPIDNAVVASLDLSTNLILRQARGLPFFPTRRKIVQHARDLIARYDVRPPRPSLPAFALSGGNLQKLVIAREMSGKPGLVIACYPAMGLDSSRLKPCTANCFDMRPWALASCGSRKTSTTS